MVLERRFGGKGTLRRPSDPSLYFPSKFCFFHTDLLRIPRGCPSALPHPIALKL